MRILLTNNTLDDRAGTELYLCEVAEALQAAGHEPVCFSLNLGKMAARLAERGIPVSDDLRALPGPPDVIHGQHFIETTLAAMTWRQVPVISFCHGPEAWQEAACQLPNVVRWIAVDASSRRRLVEDEGIDPARVTTLLNHFDERRFQPRAPLPAKPQKALIASNYLTPRHPAVLAARAACEAKGIALHTAGRHLGGIVENMETLLPQFDIVFGKARILIEAAAVGCAVVQLEYFGAGLLGQMENYDTLRAHNFGYHTMGLPLDAAVIGHELDRYDAADAALFSQRIREEATLQKTMASLIPLYAEAMTHPSPDYDPALEAGDFLRFHLRLSKLPLKDLRKTTHVPLRLPAFPIRPGGLAESWEHLTSRHVSAHSQKLEKLGRLITDLRREQEKSAAKITQLRGKLALLSEKHTRLKLDSKKPRSLWQKLRTFLGRHD